MFMTICEKEYKEQLKRNLEINDSIPQAQENYWKSMVKTRSANEGNLLKGHPRGK